MFSVLTIAAIALLHGSGLSVASSSSSAISVALLLLTVGGRLGAIGVVLAVATLGVVPQALVLGVSMGHHAMGNSEILTLIMDGGFREVLTSKRGGWEMERK